MGSIPFLLGELIRQYADLVFDTADREFLDVLAARLRRERGGLSVLDARSIAGLF